MSINSSDKGIGKDLYRDKTPLKLDTEVLHTLPLIKF